MLLALPLIWEMMEEMVPLRSSSRPLLMGVSRAWPS
jgi:hypothetical protein